MRLVKIILSGILGFVLGCGLGLVTAFGYFVRWERLSTPPQTVSELIPYFYVPPILIRTSDGSIYRYSSSTSEVWEKVPYSPNAENLPIKVKNPCDFSSPEFSFISNSPENINYCIQEETYISYSLTSYTFVIDNNGNIWQWKRSNSVDLFWITVICFSLSGLLTGLWFTISLTKKDSKKT